MIRTILAAVPPTTAAPAAAGSTSSAEFKNLALLFAILVFVMCAWYSVRTKKAKTTVGHIGNAGVMAIVVFVVMTNFEAISAVLEPVVLGIIGLFARLFGGFVG